MIIEAFLHTIWKHHLNSTSPYWIDGWPYTWNTEDSSKLKWEWCHHIARAATEAHENSKLFQNRYPTPQIAKVTTKMPQFPTESSAYCFRCGLNKHRANHPQCLDKKVECRRCRKEGNFARLCRSSQLTEVSPTIENDAFETKQNAFAFKSQNVKIP